MFGVLAAKDIIAMVVVVGYFIIKMLHLDGTLDGAFMLILGYYFAHRKNGTDKGF